MLLSNKMPSPAKWMKARQQKSKASASDIQQDAEGMAGIGHSSSGQESTGYQQSLGADRRNAFENAKNSSKNNQEFFSAREAPSNSGNNQSVNQKNLRRPEEYSIKLTSSKLQSKHNVFHGKRSDEYMAVVKLLDDYHLIRLTPGKKERQKRELENILSKLIDACKVYIQKKDQHSSTRATIESLLHEAIQARDSIAGESVTQASENAKKSSKSDQDVFSEGPGSSLLEKINETREDYSLPRLDVNSYLYPATGDPPSNSGNNQSVHQKKSQTRPEEYSIKLTSSKLQSKHNFFNRKRSDEYRTIVKLLDDYHQFELAPGKRERQKRELENILSKLIDACKVYIQKKDQHSSTRATIESLLHEAIQARDSIAGERDSYLCSDTEENSSSNSKSNQAAAPNGTTVESTAFASLPKKGHWLPGSEGCFYSLAQNGRLFRYNPTIDEVIETNLSDVDHIKLGADKSLYAWHKNAIIELTQDGSVSKKVIATENVGDFAISSNKSHLFILNKNGELTYQDLSNISKDGAKSINLSMPKNTSNPRSITTSSNGKIWLLDANGTIWQSQIYKTGSNPIVGEWKKVDSHSEPLVSLETLPDGTVAGRNITGALLCYSPASESKKSSPWKQVSVDSLHPFENFHANLQAPGKAEVMTLFGSVASKETSGLGLKSKFKTNPFVSLKKRYVQLSHYGWEKKRKNGNNRVPSMELYAAQIENYEHKLDKITASGFINFSDVDKLIGKLGWQTKEKTEKYLEVLRNSAPPPDDHTDELVNQSRKTLTQMKVVQQFLHGENDPIVQKLDCAIKDGLVVVPRISAAAAELVAEHAILAETIKKLGMGDNIDECLADAQQMLDESLAHLLCRSEIEQTDPFGHAARAFDRIQNIFLERTDVLSSIVRHVSSSNEGKSVQNKSISEVSCLFDKLINNMKTGDSITLGKSKDVGFNTEVLRLVCTAVVASASHGPVVAWAIPVIDGGKLSNVELSISKTDSGISVKILGLKGKYGQAGLRGGAGVVGVGADMDKKGIGWGFTGGEVAFKVMHSHKKEDSIVLNINDDGAGNVGRAITDIFSGRANLFELLKESANTESIKKKEKETKVAFAGVLIGTMGTEHPNWDKIQGESNKLHGPTGKPLVAFVPEAIATFGTNSAQTETKQPNGKYTKETTNRPFGLREIKGNLIGASVLETDFMKDGDAINKDGPIIGPTGRAGLPAVLPGIVLGKSWDRLGPKSKTVAMNYSSEGRPEDITVSMVINSNKIVSEISKINREIDPQKISEFSKNNYLGDATPGLPKVLEQLKKQSDSITVSMELKPEVLADLPQDNDERAAKMEELAKDLSNFRIKEMNIANVRKYTKEIALPFPGVTRIIGGKAEANTESGKVIFLYDKKSVINRAKLLLKTLGNLDAGSWGTQDRQELLRNLKSQLENLVDSLGLQTNWIHGKSLEEEYNAIFKKLRSSFMQKINTLLTHRVTDESLNNAFNALRELSDSIDRLHNGKESNFRNFGFHFEGPAIYVSGKLFTSSVGKFKQEMLEEGHDHNNVALVALQEARDAIEQLRKCNLSSKKWFEGEKAKEEAFKHIDAVKRALNSMTTYIDKERKEALLAELYSLAYVSPQEKLKANHEKPSLEKLKRKEPKPKVDLEIYDRIVRMLNDAARNAKDEPMPVSLATPASQRSEMASPVTRLSWDEGDEGQVSPLVSSFHQVSPTSSPQVPVAAKKLPVPSGPQEKTVREPPKTRQSGLEWDDLWTSVWTLPADQELNSSPPSAQDEEEFVNPWASV